MKTHNKQSIACNMIALSATMLSCCLAGAADPRQEFAEPALKYATRPLWFWNNTTVTEEGIVKQMQEARDKCGYGGFGTTIDGTFFDEPTMYRAKGRMWTGAFNEKFKAKHGFDPAHCYPALWYDIGPETQAARNYLFGFRAELYATAFPKVIQEWSSKHGIAATGHQDQEEVVNPVSVSGDLMKCFKHQDIPGVDKIGGNRPAERFYKVISSAAYNWDKALVMSETYGAMGDISWDTIYHVAIEQYTKGVNQLIPHAAWYDDGKVTFKPELSWRHDKYADGLRSYNTYISRLNLMLQNDARHVADIAVLYPIATLQAGHYLDGDLGHYLGGVAIPEADYVDVGELLATQLGRDYTFLHPEVLDDKCDVEGDVYDVEFESGKALRYIHKIHDGRHIYLIAHLGKMPISTQMELRGRLRPELWNPHTGEISKPEHTHEKKGTVDVTKVTIKLLPTKSMFITAQEVERKTK